MECYFWKWSVEENVDTNKETFQVLYPEWIHNLIEGRDISIYIEDEVDIRIAKKLAIVGLCLKVPLTQFDFTASTSSSIAEL